MEQPYSAREPVRLSVYIAAVVIALSSFFGGLALVDEVTAKVVYASTSVSLLQFAGIAFAGELARSKVWSPASLDQFVAVELVAEDRPPTG